MLKRAKCGRHLKLPTLELLNIVVVERCYIVDEEWSCTLVFPVVLEHWCIAVLERHYIAALVRLYIALEVRLNIAVSVHFDTAALVPVLGPIV